MSAFCIYVAVGGRSQNVQTHQITRLAAAASCDVRTVRKYVRSTPAERENMAGIVRERIEKAIRAELGEDQLVLIKSGKKPAPSSAERESVTESAHAPSTSDARRA